MSVIAPNTNIILIKLPIELDSENQLTFTNKTEQYNYFRNINGNLFLDNATYVRKDGTLRFNENYDDVVNYNYCMYQNESYGNKWFYAFITNMEYLSNESTAISLKTDVFQTWQFDINYLISFIEREHVDNDTVGLHTVPEGLETGEFICNSHVIDDKLDDFVNDTVYILSSTTSYLLGLDGKLVHETGGYYNGIYSATKYYPALDKSDIEFYLSKLAEFGQVDSVNGLFMAPKVLINFEGEIPYVAESYYPVTYNNSISKQTTIDGYTPKNKKVLIGDYNYLLVSNNNGASVIMRYEDFSTGNCEFKIDMAITPGCSIRMIPKNYKGITEGDEYGINLGKLPICSFPCDMYTNWMTQNSINIGGTTVSSDDLNIASNAIGAVSSVGSSLVSGDYSGALLNTATSGISIANSLIAKKQHELIPPQARGNLNAGDVISASGKNNFHFYKMSIKREYAEMIDNYFSAYGYKVNQFKRPNINTRSNWNYVKTIGCNIHVYAPNSDVQELKRMFNNGITLWHHANTFLDYNQSNNII